MSKLSNEAKDRLNKYIMAEEALKISVLSKGWYYAAIGLGPCIWVGAQYKLVLLRKSEITMIILENLFNKALKDSNNKAAAALLRYAIYNKKRFWQRHKKTKLGTLVMAEILGQHG
jgi:hypothetical protein